MSKATKAQKIRDFNEHNDPFYLVDHGDKVSLCCVFHPTPDSRFSLGQEAFNRYAEYIGDPVTDQYGMYTHGNGYEWEHVFRKAFEHDPNIGKVTYDCEAGGFFCYGESVDMMADFGQRFRRIMNDTDFLTELICKAVPEGEQREAELQQHRMSKQILIELTGENETGYCYADIYLPASAEEIEEAKERANWNSASNGICDVSIEHCGTLPKLAGLRLDSPTLEELNFLAQRLDAMDEGEHIIMDGVLQYLCDEKETVDELLSMKDLINMTYGLDSVMIASNVGTDMQLGRFVIDNELNDDVNAVPETSLYLLDLERIGQLQRNADGGVFIENCYVVSGSFEMPQVYDGVHLPEAETPAHEQQEDESLTIGGIQL